MNVNTVNNKTIKVPTKIIKELAQGIYQLPIKPYTLFSDAEIANGLAYLFKTSSGNFIKEEKTISKQSEALYRMSDIIMNNSPLVKSPSPRIAENQKKIVDLVEEWAERLCKVYQPVYETHKQLIQKALFEGNQLSIQNILNRAPQKRTLPVNELINMIKESLKK